MRFNCVRRLWVFGGADQGIEPAWLGDETVNRAGDVGNEGKQFADLEPLMAEEVVVLSRIRICSF